MNMYRRKQLHYFVVLALLFFLLTCAMISQFNDNESSAGRQKTVSMVPAGVVTRRVVRVIDGDSIVLDGGMQLRYIGIDTPEMDPVEYCAPEAEEYNWRLVGRKTLRIVRGREEKDKYGRLLGYAYVTDESGNEIFVNAALLRAGLARTLTIPPNTLHAAEFARIEKIAKKNHRGIWGNDVCKR